MATATAPKGQLTPEATKGLEYLKTINPTLAASISKSFSPASAAPIDASTLGSTQGVAVSQPPMAPVSDYTKVAISVPQNTRRQDELDVEREGVLNDIEDITTQQGTKSARKNELEAAQGLPGLNTQLNEINNLIRGEQANALAATVKSEDREAPMFAIRGEQAQIERQRAVKVYGWSAAAEAIQGNITLANDYVTKALAEEFDPLEKELEFKRSQLTENKDQWDREEGRAAEARLRQYDQDKEELAQKRADKASILEIMLTAAQYGADNQTLQKIQSAGTPQEAVSYANSVLGTAFADDRKQQDFDNGIKLAQLAIDQAKLRNDSVAAATDPAQLLAYAQQYASSGTIPSGIPKGTFGLVSQLAKELPKQDGTIVDVNTGTKPNITDVKIDGYAALYDISLKVQQLKELDTQRYKGVVSATLGKVFGSDTQQRYVDLRTEIVDLLSRARTGAALTASEEKFYADQLPGRISNVGPLGADSQTRIDNFASKINSTLDTKLKAQGASIVGFSKVNIGGQQFVVGQIVTNGAGQQGRINADGTITLIQ